VSLPEAKRNETAVSEAAEEVLEKKTSTTPKEKSELADTIREATYDGTADWQFLLLVMISIAIALLLLLPKIYLRNSIYYESRAIDRLETQYGALLEENRLLTRKVEELKVKNQILDTIF
jgi:cell division protein FtsL